MRKFKKSFLSVCAILAITSVLAACHTIHGAGQDISSGGRAISRAAS